MKCPKCNEEIDEQAKFCTKCGANIEETQKEQAEKQKEIEQKNKQIENKEEKEEKNQKNEPKKEKNKNNKKKIIIIISIILAILLATGAGITAWIILQTKEEQEETKLEWGNIYLEVLNDNDELEDMDDQQIQLCDLDKDNIPELIIYGLKNAKDYIANIYKINEKNEVETVKVSMEDEFDIKLLYNSEKEDYGWYAVTSADENKKAYDLNIESKKYKPELIETNFSTNFVEVEKNYSGKVNFDKNASKSEKEEVLETAKNEYIPTEEMITDEVKEKVENIKILKNIKKIDSSKDIIYTVVSKNISDEIYEYPCINIDSSEVRTINKEIEEKYGFPNTINSNNYYDYIGLETEEISYKYTINGNILSVILWRGGNESIWGNTYNIDLKTSKKITPEELIEQYNLKTDEVITKSYEAILAEFNEMTEKEKKSLNSDWNTLYGEKSVNEWKTKIKPSIEKLELYINEENELCLLGEYTHAGGQWSCTQTMIVNITNNYTVSELEFKSGAIQHYVINLKNTSTQTPSQSETPQTQNQTTKESSNTQEQNNNSNTSVPDIKFGTSSDVVEEGTYLRGTNGTLKITNSKPGQFDFEIECTYMTQAGYPNLGMITGTAKATSDGNFAYTERKTTGGNNNYNIIFKLAGNGITIDEQFEGYTSPYCGHNVTLEGTFIK